MEKTKKSVRRRATDDEILRALYLVIHRDKSIHSQEELEKKVRKELKSVERGLSKARLRLLALRSGYIGVNIHCREERSIKKIRLSECPVCYSVLRRLKNKTLYGRTTTVGYACTKCSYWTGLRKRIPTRYEFHRIAVSKPLKEVERFTNTKLLYEESF